MYRLRHPLLFIAAWYANLQFLHAEYLKEIEDARNGTPSDE